jgi:hypothetical protein
MQLSASRHPKDLKKMIDEAPEAMPLSANAYEDWARYHPQQPVASGSGSNRRPRTNSVAAPPQHRPHTSRERRGSLDQPRYPASSHHLPDPQHYPHTSRERRGSFGQPMYSASSHHLPDPQHHPHTSRERRGSLDQPRYPASSHYLPDPMTQHRPQTSGGRTRKGSIDQHKFPASPHHLPDPMTHRHVRTGSMTAHQQRPFIPAPHWPENVASGSGHRLQRQRHNSMSASPFHNPPGGRLTTRRSSLDLSHRHQAPVVPADRHRPLPPLPPLPPFPPKKSSPWGKLKDAFKSKKNKK